MIIILYVVRLDYLSVLGVVNLFLVTNLTRDIIGGNLQLQRWQTIDKKIQKYPGTLSVSHTCLTNQQADRSGLPT